MRVLQLIDSLEAGGAERVAVNYANALAEHVEKSFLCSTRKEGALTESISDAENYFFLNKTATLDIKAIFKLNRFIKKNRISILHAHASSFFFATIMKLLNPKIALIWHEHYGNRERSFVINKFVLKVCSIFFDSIIVVNDNLKIRSERKLFTKNVHKLSNYPTLNSGLKITFLQGKEAKRVICLANLRPDKDHLNLLKAFHLVLTAYSDWSLHLVGKDFHDGYSTQIKDYITDYKLTSHVFLYGSCPDTFHILKQSTIGVLGSKSEGLPLSLLEYGLAGLPVVATQVGDCSKVISNTNEGILVPSENHNALAQGLIRLIEDAELRDRLSSHLNTNVLSNFSESKHIETLISIYKNH